MKIIYNMFFVVGVLVCMFGIAMLVIFPDASFACKTVLVGVIVIGLLSAVAADKLINSVITSTKDIRLNHFHNLISNALLARTWMDGNSINTCTKCLKKAKEEIKKFRLDEETFCALQADIIAANSCINICAKRNYGKIYDGSNRGAANGTK